MRNDRREQQEQAALIRLIQEAHELGALNEPAIRRYFEVATLGAPNRDLLNLMNEVLTPFRTNHLINPNPFRPLPGRHANLIGDVEVGRIHETGVPYALSSAAYPHVVIVGPTGHGKSSLLFGLLEQSGAQLPYLLVTHKREDARLLVDPPIADQALDAVNQKFSLFTPPCPEEDAGAWHQKVIHLFAAAFNLKFATTLLYRACDHLRARTEQHARQTGKSVSFTPRQLLHVVSEMKSKYVDSCVNALERLCRTTKGMFECSAATPLNNVFLNKRSILIISNLRDDQSATFFVEWFITWLYTYLLHQDRVDDRPVMNICFDDAPRFVSKRHASAEVTPLDELFFLVHHARLRLTVVTQAPAQLADSVLSQAGLVIQVGALRHMHDIHVMAEALGLSRANANRLHSAQRQEFIARDERYPRPFSGVVRHFPPPSQPFTEHDRKRLMQPILDALTWQPAIPLHQMESVLQTRTTTPVKKSEDLLSDDARRLALDILATPFAFLNERYTRLELSGSRAQKAKNDLLDKGYVKAHRIPQKRGRPPILLEATRTLSEAFQQPLPRTGQGGFLHAFGIHVAKRKLKEWHCTDIQTERYFHA